MLKPVLADVRLTVTGATLVRVPPVPAIGPGQSGAERREEVEDRVGDDDVVVNPHEHAQDDHAVADTWAAPAKVVSRHILNDLHNGIMHGG